MNSAPVWQQAFSLKPNHIVAYSTPAFGSKSRTKNNTSLANLTKYKEVVSPDQPCPIVTDKTLTIADLLAMDDEAFENAWTTTTTQLITRTNGEMSPASTRKVKALLDHFLAISPNNFTYSKENKKWYKFRLNFITLTLPSPQIHPDNVIKNVCLQDFLNKLRKNAGVNHYVWKSELQSNGNIHFHITTNRFIPLLDIRAYWISALNKLGYVADYTQRSGDDNPPCTEIRSVKHINNIAAYLSGYFAKSPNKTKKGKDICSPREVKEGERISCIWELTEDGHKKRKPIAGRVYGASQSLSKLKYFQIKEGDPGFNSICSYIQKNKPNNHQMERACIWHVKLNQIVKAFPQYFASQVVNHYRNLGLTAKESNRVAFYDPTFT